MLYLFGRHKEQLAEANSGKMMFEIKKTTNYLKKLLPPEQKKDLIFMQNTCTDYSFIDMLKSETSQYHSNQTRYDNVSQWIVKGYQMFLVKTRFVAGSRHDIANTLFKDSNNRMVWKNTQLQKDCNWCLTKTTKLKVCKQCRKVAYCSQKCQKLDWKEGKHKMKCIH